MTNESLKQNVPEHVKSFMDPFIERKFTVHQGQMLLQVGKIEIEYNKSFRYGIINVPRYCVVTGHIVRLFLICNNTTPQLGSEICNKTTVVNFTSTFEGLEDQLLAVLIRLVCSKCLKKKAVPYLK